MKTNSNVLLIRKCALLAIVTSCCFVGAANAQEQLPVPGGKRSVVVNLAIERAEDLPKLQLKFKGGDVIAEGPQLERLEYEVAISGPGGSTLAYFPVPADSPVRVAYLANKDNDPQKVIDALRVVGQPVVRIVAARTPRTVETFRHTHQRCLRVFPGPWTAFYEIQLNDSSDRTRIRIPVPEQDAVIGKQLTRIPVTPLLGNRIVLHHLSGPRSDAPRLANRW